MLFQFVAFIVLLAHLVDGDVGETLVVSHQHHTNIKSGIVGRRHTFKICLDDFLLGFNELGTFTSDADFEEPSSLDVHALLALTIFCNLQSEEVEIKN